MKGHCLKFCMIKSSGKCDIIYDIINDIIYDVINDIILKDGDV